MSQTARQPALFAQPSPCCGEGAGHAVPKHDAVIRVLPIARQHTLWPPPQMDSLSVPAHVPTRLPNHLIVLRRTLQAQFKANAWTEACAPLAWLPYAPWVSDDLWRAWTDQRCKLEALVRRISYTRALIDGPYKVFMEYRACDKQPHYRVLWQGLLFGRADIYIDTNESADVLASRGLPYVQQKLAAYLHAVGIRPASAQIRMHAVSLDEADDSDADEKTDTRECRLFKTNIEKELPTFNRKRDIE